MVEFQQISADERVRVLESKYSLMRDRLFLINQNMLTEYKKLSKDIKFVEEELKDIKKDFDEIKNLLRNVLNEMQNFSKKDDLKVIEKYVNFINPLNFVTEEDVKKIIRGEKNNKKSANRTG